MSFIDDPDGPQDPLDAFLEDHFDQAIGEALDIAVDLRVDIDGKGPFWAYLHDCRREVIAHLARIDDIDASDIVTIRAMQLSVRTLKSAVGFAKRIVHGYTPPDSDSADEAENGVGEPQ